MGKIVGSLLGLGGKAPKVDTQPIQDTTDARTAADSARSALYATAGGASGDPLNPDAVQKRDTLFGN